MQNFKTYLSCVLAVMFVIAGSVAFAQSNDDCMACHEDPDMSMERRGRTVSLYTNPRVLRASPHASLSCVSCHVGFSAEDIPHKERITPVQCTSCHTDALRSHKFHASVLEAARAKGTLERECKSCHGTHEVQSTKTPTSPFHVSNQTQTCGKCHEDAVRLYNASDHGKAFAQGVKGAPSCISCHSVQITRSSNLSALDLKITQEKLCLSCHLDNEDIRKRTAVSAGFIKGYDESVHGISLHTGNPASANCVDCHGAHEVARGSDPLSLVSKRNIPTTCGVCHDIIAEEFNSSSHGVALMRGIKDAPSCTDCHGEHIILSPTNPLSPVAPRNVSGKVCTPCHSSLQLSEKYGIASNRINTFEDSYHGLAMRGGSLQVANCASCHGVHNILPSTDPRSLVHKDNLTATCGSCHPGANERFATGRVHVLYDSKEEEPILYWISTIYIILIFVIIGGMLLHNALDYYRKARNKLLMRRGLMPSHHVQSHRLYVRMTLDERMQHLSLMLSFWVLVVTGFMLRFPDAWWVRIINDIYAPAFDLRGVIHRVAGVVMILASLYHVYYLAFTKRGRELFVDILPRISDATDAWRMLKYNLGLSSDKPKFDRFSYIEKSEYWALVWGTIVMALTGVFMWFDNYFMNIFTKTGYEVARVIHYYEAWLATLAIIVWHIYFVMFNPDVYPMNLSWIKGTLTEEEMMHEHPLELERIKADGDIIIITPDDDDEVEDKDKKTDKDN
jgi:cytochrome b subunit of formate dehydrogenase